METVDKIKKSVGAYSVFLAAKNDPELVGRFTTGGKDGSLLDRGDRATRWSIADILVYMAAAYGKNLTFEEVEMGLLVAAGKTNGVSKVSAKRKSGPDLDGLGKTFADNLATKLDKDSVGKETSYYIDRFELQKGINLGYRTIEQAVGVALRNLGWDRIRNMTDGVRAYRWYAPDGFFDELAVSDADDFTKHAEDVLAEPDAEDDWVVDTEAFEDSPVESAPTKKKRSGVKSDEEMAERIRNGTGHSRAQDGVTSFELAIRHYDWFGNDIEVPKLESDMPHKVKLSVGATMKALGWKKKTRRIDGIPTVGWYAPDDWAVLDEKLEEPELTEPIEGVVIRKANDNEEAVTEEPKPSLSDQLPRLSDPVDDLPWPDMSEFSGDEDEPKGNTPMEVFSGEEVESKVFVKMVNLNDGIEDVVERVVVMKNAGTYLLGTEEDPLERLLEWDPEEEIWFCRVSVTEE